MDLGLKDKVAVITGAVGGMGEECARILVDEGAKVVLADILDEAGEALATDLGDALYVHVDVTQPDDMRNMVDRALEAFGSIDILINTAGIGGRGVGSVAEVDKWDYLFAVHVRGTAACIKEVTERAMIPQGSGKIVNVASLCNHSGQGGMSAYCAAKAAITQLTLGGARRARPPRHQHELRLARQRAHAHDHGHVLGPGDRRAHPQRGRLRPHRRPAATSPIPSSSSAPTAPAGSWAQTSTSLPAK